MLGAAGRAGTERAAGGADRVHAKRQPADRRAALAPDGTLHPRPHSGRSRPRPRTPGRTRRKTSRRIGVDAPLHALKRVPFALAVKFDKLGVDTVRDLLLFFPRRHADYGDPVPISQLELGREQTVRAQVWSARERTFGFRMRATEATIGDATGMMLCIVVQPAVDRQAAAGRTRRSSCPAACRVPGTAEVRQPGVGDLERRPPAHRPPRADVPAHRGPAEPHGAARDARGARRATSTSCPTRCPRRCASGSASRRSPRPSRRCTTRRDRPALERARRRLAFEELLPIQLTMLLRRRCFQKSAPAEPMPMSRDDRARIPRVAALRR